MRNRITRWTLAATTAAALGFGATQAVASPAEAGEAPKCKPEKCNQQCQAQGGISGRCNGDLCLCLF